MRKKLVGLLIEAVLGSIIFTLSTLVQDEMITLKDIKRIILQDIFGLLFMLITKTSSTHFVITFSIIILIGF